MKHSTLLLTFLLLGTQLLSAQNKKTVTTKVSIFTFNYAKDHTTIYLYKGKTKKDPHEIRLSSANILGPFQTTLDENNNIILRTKGLDEEGLTIYPAIASAKIPSSFKKPLLILIPGKEKVYKTIVLDRSEKNFPMGGYKFINFSPVSIRGLIGKTQVNVKSNKIITFNPTTDEEGLLKVHFQYEHDKAWKTFGRTFWPNDKERRGLLCSYVDPRTKRMKIKGIPLSKPYTPDEKDSKNKRSDKN